MFSVQFRFFASLKVKGMVIALILVTGFFHSSFGQIKAAKAEMAQYNYSKAIEILHQFIQKADPKTKSEATLLMADCYRLQNDMQDARAWYLRAIKLGNIQPLTYFYYAKALRACGDYEAAKKIFLRYDSLMPEDHRGKIYASFCDSAMAWDEKPFAFEVNNARNLNSTTSEFGPVFYNDGVIFATDRIMLAEEDKKSGWAGNGYLKLVFAKPKQKDDYYGDYNLPKLVPEFYNNGSNDGPATFSKDGNEVFITRTVKGPDKTNDEPVEGQSNQLKIFSGTKSGDKWSKLKPFFFNSNHYSVGYPALSPDGSSLYFVSDVDGGYGGTDIYVTTRDGASWNPPSNLGQIVNTFGNETFPFIADNGDLYFASDGHPGYGGLDIYVTRKVGNVWLLPQNLGKPINSSYDDFALAMYKNDSVGLFSADRPGGRGEDDIYSFRVVGPLPALTAQPAIAAVPKVTPKEEPKPAEVVVPVPSPATAEVKPPAEVVVPVPAPATAEVKPPAEEPKQEVKQEPQAAPKEEPKPAEVVVTVPAPVTAEVKPPAEEPKQEVKQEPKAAPKEEPKPAEVVVPVTAPVRAEVKPPAEEPKQEVKQEPKAAPKEEPKPAEVVVPVPSPATAEVKPPAEEPKQEVKQEPQVPPKEEPKPAEVVVPVPAPVTAEVKPPAEEPKQEVKQEPQVAPKEEPKPAEVVVPVPAPVTAEVKPPAEEPKQEVKQEPQVAPKEEPKPAEVVVPVPAPATAEVKLPAEELKQEVKQEPQVAPKEEPKPVEVVVPVPSPATAEVKLPAEELKHEVKQEPQVPPKEEPKPAEDVVPVPAPVTAEVKLPAEEPKQEVKQEPQAAPKEEPKPAEVVIPVPAGETVLGIMVSGCIKDGTTKEPIPAATVFFLDENKGQVIIHKASTSGCFRSQLITGDSYRVKAMKTGYTSDCIPFFSTPNDSQTEASISNDLLLEKTGINRTYSVGNIYYDFDRYFIRPDAEPNLNKLVQIMNENPVTVELGAHADCRGSAAYNLTLTEKRAASALHYIVQKGIKGSRITSRWYGKSQLTNNCDCSEGVHCTEAQHQANRRTEFKISIPPVDLSEPLVNLDKYREGDTVDIRLFPPDFFKNCNRRILGGPLAELLRDATLLPPDQNSGLLYTVQIGAFSYLKPHFDNLNEVMSCKGSDGIERCFVGTFSSKEEAVWFRDHMRSREFKDAFVTVMDEKHRPADSAPMVYLSKR
ncbi:MAG: OmpA family protein [Bacteroidetes bacterium]|nr:OmpA family protein [Bacteroidota bacterium]